MNTAQEILSRLAAEGVTVSVQGDKLAVSGRTSRLSPEFREQIAANRDGLIEALRAAEIASNDEQEENPFCHLSERLLELEQHGARLRVHNGRLLVWRGAAPDDLQRWIDASRIDLAGLVTTSLANDPAEIERLLELEQERALIFEHEAGMSRAEAELKAALWIECRLRCDWCKLNCCDSIDRLHTCRICGTCFAS